MLYFHGWFSTSNFELLVDRRVTWRWTTSPRSGGRFYRAQKNKTCCDWPKKSWYSEDVAGMVNMINPNQPVMHGLRSQTDHQPFWIQDGTPASWPIPLSGQRRSSKDVWNQCAALAALYCKHGGEPSCAGSGCRFLCVSCSKYLDDISGWWRFLNLNCVTTMWIEIMGSKGGKPEPPLFQVDVLILPVKSNLVTETLGMTSPDIPI
jgi:hypothetical protein